MASSNLPKPIFAAPIISYWLLYEGGKFSTSEKRGIFMDVALKIFPADYWRWWLLSNAPENSDTNFTWDSFQNTINKILYKKTEIAIKDFKPNY